MEGGNKSHIERKLDSIEYDFSEKNWEAMEALLDKQDEDVTGTLAPKDNLGSHGFFKIFGLVVILAISSLGSSNPNNIRQTLNEVKSTPSSEIKTPKAITPPPAVNLEKEPQKPIENGLLFGQNPERRSDIAIEKLKTKKLFIQKKVQWPYPKQILKAINQLDAIQLNKLDTETILPIAEQQKAKQKYHGALTSHYLYNESKLLPDYYRKSGLGLEINTQISKRSSLTFGYQISRYSKAFLPLETQYGDVAFSIPEPESEDSTNIQITETTEEDNNMLVRFSQRAENSISPSRIFSHNFYLDYFYQLNNKWFIGSGIHTEFVNIPYFGRFSSTGLNLSVQRNIGKRIYLQVNNKVGFDQNNLTPEINLNYNIGLKLGYKLF